MDYIRTSGWQAELHTFGYYQRDTNCDYLFPEDGTSQNTSIEDIGKRLAWTIYNEYTAKEQPVNVIAHSMGGLATRYALSSVERQLEGFPPELWVPNAVTLGTPHDGANRRVTVPCPFYQCDQMEQDSNFLVALPRDPQSAMGTDWTLIGSYGDIVVNWRSSTDVRYPTTWGHTIRYNAPSLSHTQIRRTTTGTFNIAYYNYKTGNGVSTDGAPPVEAAKNAAYWESDW